MRKDLEESVDPSQPALVVTYGNTNRRRRVLDRELFILGRAQACDLSLVSPEVAPVHCVLFRGSGGWLIRDCSGRPGTRVNGKVVQEILLHDTDAVQVGTFSFQLHLPPEIRTSPSEAGRNRLPAGVGPLTEELEHLRRSRRRLGELALDLRRQLKEQLARSGDEASGAGKSADAEALQRQAEQLHKRQQELDERLAQVEEDEKALVEARIGLDRDADALQKMRTRSERELTKARKEADDEMQAHWQQFEKRCRQAEEAHRQALEVRQPVALDLAPASSAPSEEAVRLDRRSQELACYARHLRKERQQLQHHLALETEVARLRTALAARTIAPPVPVAQVLPDTNIEVVGLERENERLRQENEELRARLEAPRVDQEMKVQLINREGQMASLRKQAALAAEAEEAQGQRLAQLEKELQERDALIVQLQDRLNNRGVYDTATFNALEAELIRNRREIERDRRNLTEQLHQLQMRQTEVLEAARETELQMSRERAQLAHERVELTRLREELRLQHQRKQRDSSTRDPLAALRNQQSDTVVDGKVEQAPKPVRPTNQRRRTGPSA